MASLLYRLGLFSARKPWVVILVWLLLLGATGGAAAALHQPLSTQMTVPGLQFERTLERLKKELPAASGGVGTVVFQSRTGTFTPAQKAAVATAITRWKAQPTVSGALDPFVLQAKLDGTSSKLAAGQRQIDVNQAKVDAGAAKITAGRQQLAAKQSQLRGAAKAGMITPAQAAAYQKQVDAGAAQLAAADRQLAEGRARLEAGKAQLLLGKREADLAKGTRFVSQDGTTAMTQVRFKTEINAVAPAERRKVVAVKDQLAAAGVTAHFGKELTDDVSSIAGPGEILGIVIAGVVLLVMLGTLVAAGLPLLMALVGVAVAISVVMAVSKFTVLTSTTPTLGLMIGIAVGIDYALFIVNRHRQQLKGGMDRTESIALAIGTAGNAVGFAGTTVFIALAALAVTGIGFLATMGFAAAGTVLCAVLVNLTLLPALVSLAGHRIMPRRVWRRHGFDDRGRPTQAEHRPDEEHLDQGWGAAVTRRPVLAILASLALVGLLGFPAAGLRLGLPDGGSEPESSTAFQAYSTIEQKFGAGANGPVVAVATLPAGLSETEVKRKQLDVGERLAAVAGLDRVLPAGLSQDRRTAVYQAIPHGGPADAETVRTVKQIREEAPTIKERTGADVEITGATVANIDISAKLASALPIYLVIVVGLSLVLLLMVFRSLVVPFIATGGFLLSLVTAFGGVVAVYQNGVLGSVFGVHRPSAVLSFLPILLIGVLFGLAMDYQMFLVSGMREAHVHGQDARTAVRSGFSHAAAVVTAAAIIMVSVFAGFIFAHLTMIRPIGFGLALGVLIDAFVVRMTLTPAVMHLLGERAWYLPRWLDRLIPDVDVEGVKLVDKVANHPHA
ncbi:MMPL family transporter [Arsenicicoccus dermatophilus]|uniref:MMPL family transporter n=1 Tax=Arsenicicoccus dermatophilus TaxID=1076331 RepID=UPI0039171E2B